MKNVNKMPLDIVLHVLRSMVKVIPNNKKEYGCSRDPIKHEYAMRSTTVMLRRMKYEDANGSRRSTLRNKNS